MDGSEFLETVRESNATALDRLGSEKALVAATSANLERETVLSAAAAAEARAVRTFEAWADDEPNDRAREAFREAAERERDHLQRVRALDDVTADDEPDALHEYLRSLDDTEPRAAAGLVARPLVASRSLLQVINFFINEGDNSAADRFRDLRSETDEQAEDGAAVVAAVCETTADRERAEGAAAEAIDAAYGEYADTLEGLGIDPKPVC